MITIKYQTEIKDVYTDSTNIRLGKIENDFLRVKMQIRELIEKITPEKEKELEEALKKVDSLIEDAGRKYIHMKKTV